MFKNSTKDVAPTTQTSTYQHIFPLLLGGTSGAAGAGASGSLKLQTSISKPSLETTSTAAKFDQPFNFYWIEIYVFDTTIFTNVCNIYTIIIVYNIYILIY